MCNVAIGAYDDLAEALQVLSRHPALSCPKSALGESYSRKVYAERLPDMRIF